MDQAQSPRLLIGANVLILLLVATAVLALRPGAEGAGGKDDPPAAPEEPVPPDEPAPPDEPSAPVTAGLPLWPPDPVPLPPAEPPVEPPGFPPVAERPVAPPDGVGETRWLLKQLLLALELHRARHDELPPSRTEEGNEVNAGVESLLARLDAEGLLATIPRGCGRGDTDGDGREEILDAWGNPLVYFRHDRYDASERVRIGGTDQAAAPQISRLTREHHARDHAQIWSAGPNGENENGGGDDVTSWHIRE